MPDTDVEVIEVDLDEVERCLSVGDGAPILEAADAGVEVVAGGFEDDDPTIPDFVFSAPLSLRR